MSGNFQKLTEEKIKSINSNSFSKQTESKEKKFYTLSCVCCNQDIIGNKFIGIVHYGTMIHLCGEPCGIRDYLETQ